MAATHTSEFTFKPEGKATSVTWSMEGDNSFIAKAMCILMNHDMDKMVGGNFQEGLANLNAVVQAQAAPVVKNAPKAKKKK